MQVRKLPSRTGLVLACILSFAVATAAVLAQQQKGKKEQGQKEEKKGGGLFAGFTKATGRGEQREATVSAGAKGVGEGKEIGKSPVSSDARSRVAAMEAAKPSEEEMEAFLKEGNLSPPSKGGSS